MKCSECSHEMIEAKNGHMCLNCGHSVPNDPSTTSLVPGDNTAPVPAAVASTVSPASNDEVKSEAPASEAVPVEASKDEAKPDEHVVAENAPAAGETQPEIKALENPAAEPAEAETSEATVSDVPGVKDEPKSEVSDTEPKAEVSSDETNVEEPSVESGVDASAAQASVEAALAGLKNADDKAEEPASEPEKTEDHPEISNHDSTSAAASEDAAAPAQDDAKEASSVSTDIKPVDGVATGSSEPLNLKPTPVVDAPVAGAPSMDAVAAPAAEPVTHTIDHSSSLDTSLDKPAETVAPEITPEKADPTDINGAHITEPTNDVPPEPVIPAHAPLAPTLNTAVVVAAASAPEKAPLVAKTHPEGTGAAKMKLAIAAVALVVLGVGGYFFFFFKLPVAANLSNPTVAGVSTEATPKVTPTPAATPTAQDRDTQRQGDLAKYAVAYLATAQNGYFATTPPTVSVSATDPSSGVAYQVVTTKPAAPGQVYYWAGGQCNAPAVTPGRSSTHYLALETVLEGSSTPYCLDVK